MNPRNGEVMCSISLPAKRPISLAFGECPNSKTGKLNCLYVTSESGNIVNPTEYDGTLMLIEGLEDEGVPAYKVQVQ